MTTVKTEAAFTSGPWGCEQYGCDWDITYDLTLHHGARKLGSAFDEANARLIAAAPDLYGVLTRLLHELEWVNEQLDLMPDDYADALTFASAALAKTRGDAPSSKGLMDG